MCRLAFYIGPEIRISSLVTEPDNSIISQSYQSKEGKEPLNGDGFGLAWYVPNLSRDPALFRDISPAWSNQNLLNVTRMVESGCILVHVRAATAGLPVIQVNCHPFKWKQFAFMHNGSIGGFYKMRRTLQQKLSDEAYNVILGSTDSEYAFALFIDHYQRLSRHKEPLDALIEGTRDTIDDLESLRSATETDEVSWLNFVITNGKESVISRFISSETENSASLYYREGSLYVCNSGCCHMEDDRPKKAVLVASEPLSEEPGWRSIDNNHLLIIHADRSTELQAI